MDINDIRNYIQKYYIDQIDDIYDKVKIKDIDRTINECDIKDMRTITYTSDGTTETHQLLILIHFLNGLIEKNVTENTRTPYDLVYVSKHNLMTRGWVDLIGLKNMNIIKERVLLNNRCEQAIYENAVDESIKKTAKLMIIPLGIYIKTFFDLLPPAPTTYEPESPEPPRIYKARNYDTDFNISSNTKHPPPPPGYKPPSEEVYVELKKKYNDLDKKINK